MSESPSSHQQTPGATPSVDAVRFLQEYPLYRKATFEGGWSWPLLRLRCDKCARVEPFKAAHESLGWLSWDSRQHGKTRTAEGPFILAQTYFCQGHCGFAHTFALEVTELSKRIQVQKIGQSPAPTIATDPPLAKFLGANEDAYRKGRINESQGYGIGAFAYYRRIVEVIIDGLLSALASHVDETKQGQFRECLASLKDENQASRKIEVVKDMLPSRLKPKGQNPLSTLHSSISLGLHSLSDEECLERAEDVRVALVFLASELQHSDESSKSYVTALDALNTKRKKPPKRES